MIGMRYPLLPFKTDFRKSPQFLIGKRLARKSEEYGRCPNGFPVLDSTTLRNGVLDQLVIGIQPRIRSGIPAHCMQDIRTAVGAEPDDPFGAELRRCLAAAVPDF